MHCARSETQGGTGAGTAARVTRLSVVVALLTISAVIAAARPPAAGADQVSSLSAQARSISQELVQEELEADAYQQQYSVASAQVAADQRAIAATQLLIKSDRQQIARRTHQVERIAIASYVLNGAVSSTSGASLFAENVSTVQSANEYASITIGNLNEAVEKLHSAQRSVQGTLEVLVRQSDSDRAEQAAQATYLSQSTSTVSHMETVQAQVTGQLAAAVAQQNAALGQAAAAAVATAQKATVQKSGGAGGTSTTVPTTSSPGTAVVSVTDDGPRSQPVPPVRSAGGIRWRLSGGVAKRPLYGRVPIQPVHMELCGAGSRPRQSGRRPAQSGDQGRTRHRRRGSLCPRRRAALAG